MNSIIFIIVTGIIIWILQALFGFIQMKNFNKNFVEMRKKGKIVIGFKKGFIVSGTIVMIRINEEGDIEELRCMQGVTVFAKFKRLDSLNGKNLLSLQDEDLKRFNKLLRKTIMIAVENYKNYLGGDGEEKQIENTENVELEQLIG